MGRTYGYIKLYNGTGSDKPEDLNAIGTKLASKTIKLECYLFASILTNAMQANDIDILIIYENQEQLEIVKK